MKFLTGLDVNNYKSFLDDSFKIDDFITIVGPNESGKTNVLEAIKHISKDNQSTPFDDGDLRFDCPDFPEAKIKIKYHVLISKKICPDLCFYFPMLENTTLTLAKEGELKGTPSWSVVDSEIPLSRIHDLYIVEHKTNFKQGVKNIKEDNINKLINFSYKTGWLINNSTVNFSHKPFNELIRSGALRKASKEEKKKLLHSALQNEILTNINVLFWEYKKDSSFFPERVSIEDFVSNPNKREYESINNIFLVAGWRQEDYWNKLVNLDLTTRKNALQKVEDKLNRLIKNHWSTHKNLQVNLSFEGSDLSIELKEPGHKTPPNYRSDGFKWFLSFLLFFKKHSSNLEQHIILLDEPGLYLHPQGQKDILKELVRISKENQIIYSTHQTFLIDKNNPQSVRVVKREPRKVHKKTYYDSTTNELDKGSNVLSDKLLREALGFIVSDISPVNEKNILVEGKFDRDILLAVNRFTNILDFNEVSIIECHGAPNIRHMYLLCKNNGLRAVGLYESDKGGKNAYNSDSSKVVEEKILLDEMLQKKNIETIEDLVPKDIFETSFDAWKKRNSLTIEKPTKKPRMKPIIQVINNEQKERKLELKHDLETELMKSINSSLSKRISEYDEVKLILSKLKENL